MRDFSQEYYHQSALTLGCIIVSILHPNVWHDLPTILPAPAFVTPAFIWAAFVLYLVEGNQGEMDKTREMRGADGGGRGVEG